MDRATVELVVFGVAALGAVACVSLIWRRKGDSRFGDLSSKLGLLLFSGGLATISWGCMAMRNTGYDFFGALQSVQWWVLATWLALAAALFLGPSRDS